MNVHTLGEDLYYIDELKIHIKSESAQEFVPTLTLKGVYVTGGTINAIQDGNPLQDIYSFTALNLVREDRINSGGG